MSINDVEKQLKVLARELVWIKDKLDDEKLRDWEEDEIRQEYSRTLRKLYDLGYSEHMVTNYMEEYRHVKLGEYQKWLNGESIG
jgi:hypothetical protein